MALVCEAAEVFEGSVDSTDTSGSPVGLSSLGNGSCCALCPKLLKTTVVGAYPKPGYVRTPDWFRLGSTGSHVGECNDFFESIEHGNSAAHQYAEIRGIKEVIQTQQNLGIDIVTDGELKRENYISYHLRHLDGFDFNVLTETTSRNGAYIHRAPTIVGKIKPRDGFLIYDVKLAELFLRDDPQSTTCSTNGMSAPSTNGVDDRAAESSAPRLEYKPVVKATIPGPMTIRDTVANKYYTDKFELYEDLAAAINCEIKHLVANGCRHVQVDEPLWARYPEDCVDHGVKFVEKCFAGITAEMCQRTVHMCCGYPDKLNETEYPKAHTDAYLKIAGAVDASDWIDVISLEDAHRHNSLDLFRQFKNTVVMLGVLRISYTEIETVEEIKERIQEVLTVLPPERLMIAPDCGLAMLPEPIVVSKLKNMVEATNALNLKIAEDRGLLK